MLRFTDKSAQSHDTAQPNFSSGSYRCFRDLSAQTVPRHCRGSGRTGPSRSKPGIGSAIPSGPLNWFEDVKQRMAQ